MCSLFESCVDAVRLRQRRNRTVSRTAATTLPTMQPRTTPNPTCEGEGLAAACELVEVSVGATDSEDEEGKGGEGGEVEIEEDKLDGESVRAPGRGAVVWENGNEKKPPTAESESGEDSNEDASEPSSIV